MRDTHLVLLAWLSCPVGFEVLLVLFREMCVVHTLNQGFRVESSCGKFLRPFLDILVHARDDDSTIVVGFQEHPFNVSILERFEILMEIDLNCMSVVSQSGDVAVHTCAGAARMAPRFGCVAVESCCAKHVDTDREETGLTPFRRN